MKNLLSFLMLLLVGGFFFSCSSNKEYFRFTSAHPEAFNKVKARPSFAAAAAMAETNSAITAQSMAAAPAPALLAQAEAPPKAKSIVPLVKVPAVLPRLSAVNQPTSVATAAEVAQVRERLASLNKAEKKAFKKDMRRVIADYMKGQQSDVSLVLLIILAILLPPLAVGLKDGLSSRFWLSVLLTLLFFLPGVIYALLVVTDSI